MSIPPSAPIRSADESLNARSAFPISKTKTPVPFAGQGSLLSTFSFSFAAGCPIAYLGERGDRRRQSGALHHVPSGKSA